jgi:hypothetical protein
MPSPSASGFVAPPQLPAHAPNAPLGYGVPFSYNIPPGNDTVGPGFDTAAKPLNTNHKVCSVCHKDSCKCKKCALGQG